MDSPDTALVPARPAISNSTLRRSVAVVVVLALMAGSFILGNHYQIDLSQPLHPQVISLAADSPLSDPLFNEVQELMKTKYLRRSSLDQKQMVYGAISGMVASAGDPYTSFFDPSANQDIQSQLSGTYEGIGAELGYKDNQIVVLAPLKDSPALAAGVKAGDEVLKVNDKDTTGMTLQQVVTLIRGKAGTSVKITIMHDGSDTPQVLDIKRQQITVSSIDLTYKDNPATPAPDQDIAYIRLSRFGDTTITEWDKAVDDLTAHGAKELVLDLRNNPGGYLEAAIHIGSEFFSDGVIVGQQDAQGKVTNYSVDHPGRLTSMPVTVLINKGSASASEIVSGALKARHRAHLVGDNSFGKGSVQQVIDLPQNTSLHVTIAKWLTPDGKNIDKVGIKPDKEVALPDDAISQGKDPQLDAAITDVTTSPAK